MNKKIRKKNRPYKRGLKKPRHRNEVTKMALDNIAEGILLLGKDFRIHWANRKIMDLTHLKENKIIGDFCYKITHHRDDPCQPPHDVCPVEEVLKSGNPTHVIHTHFDKDGNEFYAEVSAYPIRDKKGQISQFVHIARDVTGRVKAEKELKQAYARLKETQTQLIQSAKMSTIGQLGAGVAHEINNPLGGILGYAQYILQKLAKPDFSSKDFKTCKRYVQYIEKESKRCKAIVENLLTFSRKPAEKPMPLDITRALESTLSIIGHQLELKNIRISTDYEENLPPVSGNINQLQQIFTNIVLNAQHAMPEGGKLDIRARTKQVQGKKQVEISFKDSGCGISTENLEKIFEAFFTTKKDWKSLGLGLSICYQIIKEHKGSISVDSKVGAGTTFTIILPASPITAAK